MKNTRKSLHVQLGTFRPRGNLAPDKVLAILDKEDEKNRLEKNMKAMSMIPSNVRRVKDGFNNKDCVDIDAYPGHASDEDDFQGENVFSNNVKKIPKLALANFKSIKTKYQ